MLRNLSGIERTITLREEALKPMEERTQFRVRMMTHRETVEFRVGLQDETMRHTRDPVKARSDSLAEFYANSFMRVVRWIDNYQTDNGEGGPRLEDPRAIYDFAWHYMTEDQVLEVIERAREGSANLIDEAVRKNELPSPLSSSFGSATAMIDGTTTTAESANAKDGGEGAPVTP